jgi:acetyl esterase/lipase
MMFPKRLLSTGVMIFVGLGAPACSSDEANGSLGSERDASSSIVVGTDAKEESAHRADDASAPNDFAEGPDSTSPADATLPTDATSDAPLFSDFEPLGDAGYLDVNLYAGNPPNFKADAPPETIGAGGRIYSVSVPTLRRYPLNLAKATGIGLIVFPGGGYDHLDIENHATALANRMGPTGVAVFGLKYRVTPGTDDVQRDALLDANRAVRLVRSQAARWGILPDRLGVVSYSAGSHLSMSLAGHFDAGRSNDPDPVERESSRPTFIAAMCTWAFGSTMSPFTFLATTPPTFMCHAQDDTTAPIALAMQIEKQLQTLGVLVHLEVYPTGGHNAFNVGDNVPGRDWPDKLMPWLRDNHVVPVP